MQIRKHLRLWLAALLVAVPAAYLLWQWTYVDEPVLPGLSYTALNETLSGAHEPPFWTYAIWVFLVFAAMAACTKGVAWVLARVFPDTPR